MPGPPEEIALAADERVPEPDSGTGSRDGGWRITRRALIGGVAGLAAAFGIRRALETQAILQAAAPQPEIISRAGWGANEAWRFSGGVEVWPPGHRHYTKAFVHHTVTTDGGDDPAAVVRSIYYYHAVSQGWGDIGYNYLIDQAGRIYEGRYGGSGVIGGHALAYNPGSVGIAAIGNFGQSPPSDAMLASYVSLLTWLCNRWGVDPRGSSFLLDKTFPNICGHRDAINTACPGDGLYGRLGSVRQAVYDRLPEYGQSFVSTSTPRRLGAGQQTSVSITIRNGGKRTWIPAQFRIGYRWLDSQGQVVPLTTAEDLRTPFPRDVPLGDQITMNAQLVAPSQEGAYTLEWDVVHNLVTWLTWTGVPGLRIPVVVGNAVVDAAQFLANTMPSRMAASQLSTVSITVRNTGTTTWGNTGRFAYRLGYRWYDGSGNQIVQAPENDLRTSLPRPIEPGQSITLQAQVRAPVASGPVTIRWDMVHEGFHWFSDRGSTPLNVPVTLESRPYAAQFTWNNMPGWVRSGQYAVITFQVRNNGTNTWTSGGRNGYRLGYRWFRADGQQFVQSAADDIRTSLASAVGPGEETWLQAGLRVPEEEGTYTLQWDMVHEGVAWFVDRGSAPLRATVVVSSSDNPRSRFFPQIFRAWTGGW